MECFNYTDEGRDNHNVEDTIEFRALPFRAWSLREYTVYMMGLGCSLEMACMAALETPFTVRMHTLYQHRIYHPWLEHGGRCR